MKVREKNRGRERLQLLQSKMAGVETTPLLNQREVDMA